MIAINENLKNHRVSRARPCPVCERPDWCLVGDEWAICQRVESGERWKEAGWLHRFKGPVQPIRYTPRRLKPNRIEDTTSQGPRPQPTATYFYNDERGEPLYRKLRFKRFDGGKYFRFERFERWDKSVLPAAMRWVGGRGCMEGVRRVLYRLELLANDLRDRIYIVEGEKCVDLLWDFGLLATTNDDGAGKWRDEYAIPLAGREIIILPDNDDPGRDHAELVSASLNGIARSIKVVHLPGLPDKGDVFDWLTERGESL